MITGDDPRCVDAIESALPFVDRVVVNHNGTDDKVREAIEEIELPEDLELDILEDKWKGSFSYHRNLVADYASQDCTYAFVLDADEILDISAPEGIETGAVYVRDKITIDKPVVVTTHSDIGNGKRQSFEGVRLYHLQGDYPGIVLQKEPLNPKPGWHYMFRAHNYLCNVWDGLPPTSVVRVPSWFNIRHSGYTPVEIKKFDKSARTLGLLEADWKEYGHILTAFYLTREHMGLNNYLTAEIWWQEVIERWDKAPKPITGMINPYAPSIQSWLEARRVSAGLRAN